VITPETPPAQRYIFRLTEPHQTQIMSVAVQRPDRFGNKESARLRHLAAIWRSPQQLAKAMFSG
jgi:hypothetical protein